MPRSANHEGPSIVRVLVDPDVRKPAPAPVQVDLRRVALVGIAAWAVTLVVFAVLEFTDAARVSDGPWIALAGIALGGAALIWEHRHRIFYRSLAQGAKTSDADADPVADGSDQSSTGSK